MSIVKVERSGENGFEIKDMDVNEALIILNNDIKNEMTIWIDGRPFDGESLSLDDISKCKTEISVTNRLVGG